jgi:REP element-mobilizing transposase RayT
MPTPLYQPTATSGAHRLHYSWTAWPPSGTLFSSTLPQLIKQTAPLWQTDGLQLIESQWTTEELKILFAATPDVSPVFLAARAKGRLDHALRAAGLSLPFSRKVSVRSLGENTRRDVEAYIEHQVDREQFVDPRFEEALSKLQYVNEAVNLSQPIPSSHGRYWYNLHLVLVTDHRYRIRDLDLLRNIRDAMLKIAAKKEHSVSRLSVLPDRLHAALRPQVEESPLEVVFAYLNNLTHMLARGRLFQDGYYVGIFSEYSTHVITDPRE